MNILPKIGRTVMNQVIGDHSPRLNSFLRSSTLLTMEEPETLFLAYLSSSNDTAPAHDVKCSGRSNCVDDSIPIKSSRVTCESCGRSRSIFCPQCLKLLTKGPPVQLKLPFDLDILLDDKRETATGLQVKVLSEECPTQFQCRLFDYDKGHGESFLDTYDGDVEGTYLLYPGENSIPMNQVEPSEVSRLVVLDCKWTGSSLRLHKNIERLPKLHLTNAPNESQYWRWHSAGKGMLSTIEAIYYSAWELSRKWSDDDRRNLVNIFWIFRMQRRIIKQRHESGQVRQDELRPKAPPFSEEQKEFQRNRRAALKKRRLDDLCFSK